MPYLLERLATRPKTLDGREESFDVLLAIAAQLQRIVSAHRCGATDGVLGAAPFGTPHIVDVSGSSVQELKRYAEILKNMIKLNEPRLGGVSVDLEKQTDPLTPYRLIVSGVLTSEGRRHRFPVEA